MAKFNWKSIFIQDAAGEAAPQEETESTPEPRPSFPDKGTSFPNTERSVQKFPNEVSKNDGVNQRTLNTIVEMYEAGFESLNQPGYDFYEFFKAIKAVGSNDPQVYKMALTMAQSSDPKVTKSALLSQADFYIAEINKVHAQYESQGHTKKAKLQETLKGKKTDLAFEIATMEQKLMDLQNQISAKKNDLQSLDSGITSDVAEIDQKIIANNLAKAKILETITTVVNGIKSNL